MVRKKHGFLCAVIHDPFRGEFALAGFEGKMLKTFSRFIMHPVDFRFHPRPVGVARFAFDDAFVENFALFPKHFL